MPIRLAAAMLVALSATALAAPQGLVERGRALAERHCAACHAVGPAGRSAVAGAPPLRDLSRRYPVEALAEALAEGIMTGHAAMPEFRFAPPEIDALLAYLETLGR